MVDPLIRYIYDLTKRISHLNVDKLEHRDIYDNYLYEQQENKYNSRSHSSNSTC